jgi:hypothetical protein
MVGEIAASDCHSSGRQGKITLAGKLYKNNNEEDNTVKSG